MRKCPTRPQCCLLSPCLLPAVCVHPLMSVSQASYGHHRSLAFDCLFSGPDTGGSFGEKKCKRGEKQKIIQKSMLNVHKDA